MRASERTYKTMVRIEEKFYNLNPKHITHLCNGGNLTLGGQSYQYKRIEDKLPEGDYFLQHTFPIVVYNGVGFDTSTDDEKSKEIARYYKALMVSDVNRVSYLEYIFKVLLLYFNEIKDYKKANDTRANYILDFLTHITERYPEFLDLTKKNAPEEVKMLDVVNGIVEKLGKEIIHNDKIEALKNNLEMHKLQKNTKEVEKKLLADIANGKKLTVEQVILLQGEGYAEAKKKAGISTSFYFDQLLYEGVIINNKNNHYDLVITPYHSTKRSYLSYNATDDREFYKELIDKRKDKYKRLFEKYNKELESIEDKRYLYPTRAEKYCEFLNNVRQCVPDFFNDNKTSIKKLVSNMARLGVLEQAQENDRKPLIELCGALELEEPKKVEPKKEELEKDWKFEVTDSPLIQKIYKLHSLPDLAIAFRTREQPKPVFRSLKEIDVSEYVKKVSEALNEAVKFLKSHTWSIDKKDIRVIINIAIENNGLNELDDAKLKQKITAECDKNGIKHESYINYLAENAQKISGAFQIVAKEIGLVTPSSNANHEVGARLKWIPTELVDQICAEYEKNYQNFKPQYNDLIRKEFESRKEERKRRKLLKELNKQQAGRFIEVVSRRVEERPLITGVKA